MQLTPMPTTATSLPLSPSIRMPANFASDSRRSFGHLIASLGFRLGATSTTASCSGERGDERELGPMLGLRRLGQQQAGVEISGLGHPRAAATAAPGALPLRRDPERAAFAAPRPRQRFRIGRVERLACHQPHAGAGRPGIESHHVAVQNSALAAVLAASIKGAG